MENELNLDNSMACYSLKVLDLGQGVSSESHKLHDWIQIGHSFRRDNIVADT